MIELPDLVLKKLESSGLRLIVPEVKDLLTSINEYYSNANYNLDKIKYIKKDHTFEVRFTNKKEKDSLIVYVPTKLGRRFVVEPVPNLQYNNDNADKLKEITNKFDIYVNALKKELGRDLNNIVDFSYYIGRAYRPKYIIPTEKLYEIFKDKPIPYAIYTPTHVMSKHIDGVFFNLKNNKGIPPDDVDKFLKYFKETWKEVDHENIEYFAFNHYHPDSSTFLSIELKKSDDNIIIQDFTLNRRKEFKDQVEKIKEYLRKNLPEKLKKIYDLYDKINDNESIYFVDHKASMEIQLFDTGVDTGKKKYDIKINYTYSNDRAENETKFYQYDSSLYDKLLDFIQIGDNIKIKIPAHENNIPNDRIDLFFDLVSNLRDGVVLDFNPIALETTDKIYHAMFANFKSVDNVHGSFIISWKYINDVDVKKVIEKIKEINPQEFNIHLGEAYKVMLEYSKDKKGFNVKVQNNYGDKIMFIRDLKKIKDSSVFDIEVIRDSVIENSISMIC